MNRIVSLESTSRSLYVVTLRYIIQRDVLTMGELQRWDLPSPPCSALMLSSHNEDHWSIVCAKHLRTHEMTLTHGFDFAQADDPRAPISFLSMHEIGVMHMPETTTDHERNGIRLVQYNPNPFFTDVCQQGKDVIVRKHNNMMERIANATLLHCDARRGMLLQHGTEYWLYDKLGRNRWFIVSDLPTPAAAPVYAIVGTAARPLVVVGNVSRVGKLEILDRWWWWVYLRWAFWISMLLGVLLAFAS